MSTKTLIWGFRRWLGDQGFWVVTPCGWVMCSRGFEKPYRLYSPSYELIYGLQPPGISYPTMRRNSPLCLLLQYEHRFATKKISKRWVISSGKAATSPFGLTASFAEVFVLSTSRFLHKWQEGQLLFNIALLTYCVAIDLFLLILCRNDLKCLRFSPRGLIKSTALKLCVLDVSDPFQIGVFGQEHFQWRQAHLITIMP